MKTASIKYIARRDYAILALRFSAFLTTDEIEIEMYKILFWLQIRVTVLDVFITCLSWNCLKDAPMILVATEKTDFCKFSWLLYKLFFPINKDFVHSCLELYCRCWIHQQNIWLPKFSAFLFIMRFKDLTNCLFKVKHMTFQGTFLLGEEGFHSFGFLCRRFPRCLCKNKYFFPHTIL